MNSTDLIRAYFDSVAATWLPSESDDSARKAIISLSQVPSGCEIADIGCGKGVMLPYLLGLDPKSICEIDVSAEMIRLCKATCSDDRVHFIADDFLTMPEMAFDFIIIFNAYPHFTDKRAFSR
ncbi:MAG: class I SAM-dependent methyltransferase, partial [Oscillospiraceae bacterium]